MNHIRRHTPLPYSALSSDQSLTKTQPNAIILAAGAATRFAPLSFEKPKAMYEVRGEILIERLIRQLQEAKITDITIVVGYMKEAFYYLVDKYGVHIIENKNYATRNNYYSLWLAKSALANTYVLSSDEYYPDNLFLETPDHAYISAAMGRSTLAGHDLKADDEGRLVSMDYCEEAENLMQGPAFLDAAASETLVGLLDRIADMPQMFNMFWDDVVAMNLDQFELSLRPLSLHEVYEFNYVQDLCVFDADFFMNVDSTILENICTTLHCTRADIKNISPINAGLTNLSVLFSVDGIDYVYRHPGVGTDKIINRESEVFALKVAHKIGLDQTYVYADIHKGWKISKFIPNCIPFDYTNQKHVTKALELIRVLHKSGETSPWHFDFLEQALAIIENLKAVHYPLPRDFDELLSAIKTLGVYIDKTAGDPVFCHNDFYGPNFLINDDVFYLIDWEYAGMGDYGYDLGNFIAQGSGYTIKEAVGILPLYFGRTPTETEVAHCMACTAVVGFYWYVWALYKESTGSPVDEWVSIWYKAGKIFSKYALGLIKDLGSMKEK